MNLYRHSGMGRPIDPRIPSNRAAIVGTVGGGALYILISLIVGSPDLFAAVGIGAAVFLAWAITRELDPDNPSSAALAMALTFGLGLIAPPSLGVVAVALIGLRLVVGSVGARLKPGDYIVILIAAAYAGANPEAWPAVALLGIGVAMARPISTIAAELAIAIAATLGYLLGGQTIDFALPSAPSALLILLTLTAASTLLPTSAVNTVTDARNGTISPRRVDAGRIGAASMVVWASLVVGAGVASVGPLVAGLIGPAAIVWSSHRHTRQEGELQIDRLALQNSVDLSSRL